MEFDVEHLSYLSKLEFSEDEKKAFETEFSSVLDFVGEISGVQLSEEIENDKPILLSNLREDEPKESLSREQILANAPKQKDGCFVAPLVVE